MKLKYLTISVGIATALWIASPLFINVEPEETSHPVRVMGQDVETLVFGHDNVTDFVPGVHTGGLVISPEDDFYNSLELMARVVEAEAGNQGLLGKRMVVDVILNRVRDEDFPDTIAGVITEKHGECAFTSYGNGMYGQVEISEETWTAIRMELGEVSYPGLLYFCSTGFHECGTDWKKVGDHYFSTK